MYTHPICHNPYPPCTVFFILPAASHSFARDLWGTPHYSAVSSPDQPAQMVHLIPAQAPNFPQLTECIQMCERSHLTSTSANPKSCKPRTQSQSLTNPWQVLFHHCYYKFAGMNDNIFTLNSREINNRLGNWIEVAPWFSYTIILWVIRVCANGSS